MIADEERRPQLYIVRHGETSWSLSGQHTGQMDLPLTERGEEEARALGPALRSLVFTRVLTSPRQRASRTCELVGLKMSSEIDADLSEWDYGKYEGRRTIDIWRDRPDWNLFRDGCPGGEMPAQVSARADRLIARLLILSGNVAVFSHGHFSCVLAARWIGAPVTLAQHFEIGTASLGILSHEPHLPTVRVIALWNATPTVQGDVIARKQLMAARDDDKGAH